MIFATVLSLCVGATDCNDYIVDVATTNSDCMTNLITHSSRMSTVWMLDNMPELEKYLKTFNIVEPDVEAITDYDFTCKMVADRDIP